VARKYFVETFGCQMNFHDSERVAGLLEHEGYEHADSVVDADLVVVNTCSVRERAVDKLYSRLGEIQEATAGRLVAPVIAVTGCVAQQEGQALFRRSTPIDVVVGTQALKQLPALVDRTLESRRPQLDVHPYDDVSFPLGVVRHADPVRARVTIIEGCNEFCAFCVVPYTRGHERMRPVADILAECRLAAETGHREVQLLGQIVNHYQAPDDATCDFAGLLERASDIPGLARIRFASPHPRHVTDRLIAAIRDLPKVCKHLHVPVQSGSDGVLRAMRRRYTRDEYFDLVDRARAAVPDLAVTTDMIVGFPGETAEDFDLTLDLVRRVRFHAMYSFKYSPRPNTLAIKRMADDVGEADKTARILALQALQADIQTEWHRQTVGRTVEVLVEGPSKRRGWELSGRTTGYTVVNFPGPEAWVGELLPVQVTSAEPHSLRGEAVVAAAGLEVGRAR
jgi:tRNA-2-methylthio-N6-dimethylallyladenosine synthase